MFTCKDHVKKGLDFSIFPHIKKVTYAETFCHFCKEKAKYKLFQSRTMRAVR